MFDSLRAYTSTAWTPGSELDGPGYSEISIAISPGFYDGIFRRPQLVVEWCSAALNTVGRPPMGNPADRCVRLQLGIPRSAERKWSMRPPLVLIDSIAGWHRYDQPIIITQRQPGAPSSERCARPHERTHSLQRQISREAGACVGVDEPKNSSPQSRRSPR